MGTGEYYAITNTAISNSKIRDFVKSRHYYWERHVAGTAGKDMTPAMMVGLMVDAEFSGYSVEWWLKENMGEKVRTSDIEKSKEIAHAMKSSAAFKWYEGKNVMKQRPLVSSFISDNVLVHHCGIPDAITIHEDKVYIDDLKVTAPSNFKTAKAWSYRCADMGYFRQMGNYCQLVAECVPEAKGKEIICRHLVMGSVKDGVYPAAVFTLDSASVARGWTEFKELATEITRLGNSEANFVDEPVAWDTAESIGYQSWDTAVEALII